MKKFALLATGLLVSGSLLANADISTVAPTLEQHQACLKDIKIAVDAANAAAQTTSTAPSNLLLKLNTLSSCHVPGLLLPMPTAAELKAAADKAAADKAATTKPAATSPQTSTPNNSMPADTATTSARH